ncbi:SAVED domain-containing protein [Corallococcus sp. BB11-1]|uniref:SAVED domain-containing protein n=1 Tax=Corallococcus sp. BB11-1 TaxID=2996783 RepID=UPI0010DE7B33|nr:SAVED domain-containing protein [Corallococcus sp. BB11-1]MCY1036813.1 SAVED domain-containing protein [Corallococcus sp. BB11-1]RYZ18055.1 MAG: SAVED domain-containing protein [Myxococcaceae bacterium]
MDVPVRTQSRALLLRYEHDRPVIESAARDAITRAGMEGHQYVENAEVHGHDPDRDVRKLRPQDWAGAFVENDRFAEALTRKEAELGVDHLPVHLFSLSPLMLVLHLASRLPRRPLCVYQQSQGGGWSLGYQRSQLASEEPFFEVEGLPTGRQGGRGHVALIVEVTRSIQDKAVAQFKARHPTELLATVILRPVHGVSPTAFQGPAQASRAAEQFRQVLDALHERLEGVESVLLAMDGPASLAAALGTVVNPETQHPLRLHHFDPDTKEYASVHLMRPRRAEERRAVPLTAEQLLDATRVLTQVRQVHQDLVAWLKEEAQRPLVTRIHGSALLKSQIADAPATSSEPLYRHLKGRWSFHADLLLGLEALRKRLGSDDDWKECVRLLLVHEVFHVGQGGLTSYNYSGSGRTGFVLEVADFDADEVAIQVALEWRKSMQGGTVQKAGVTRTLETIVWNVVESLRVFEPDRPVMELSERRLRRYLIWFFHACRLSALGVETKAHSELGRVTMEIAGLPTFPDPYERYAQQRIRLDRFELGTPVAVAVYFQHQLVREQDHRAWVERLFKVLREWDSMPLEDARDAMRSTFEELFDRHRQLIALAP